MQASHPSPGHPQPSSSPSQQDQTHGKMDEDKQMRHISRHLLETYILVTEGFRTCRDRSTHISTKVLAEIQSFLIQARTFLIEAVVTNIGHRDLAGQIESAFQNKCNKKSELFKRLENSIFYTIQSLVEVKPVGDGSGSLKMAPTDGILTSLAGIHSSNAGLLAESTYLHNNTAVSQILPLQDIFWSNQALNYLDQIDDLFLESKYECCCVTTSPQQDYFIGQFNGCVEKRNLLDTSRNETFRVIAANENCNIRCIRRDPRGRLWISTTDTLIVTGRNGKVVFRKKGTSSTNLLYGYLYKLWVNPNWSHVIWWSGLDSFMIIDARNLKILHLRQGLLVNPGELPSDFSVIGADSKHMLILTNYKRNRQYHWVQLRTRRIKFNMRIPGPSDSDGLRVGFMSLSQNCPSSLIVATGSSNTLEDPVPKGLITSFHFNPVSFRRQQDVMRVEPSQLIQETNLTYIAQDTQDLGPLITKPTFLSSRLVICIIIKHVCLYDVGEQHESMSLLVRIRNVNRGESVTDICVRNKAEQRDVLCVGNCGQIFRLKFKI